MAITEQGLVPANQDFIGGLYDLEGLRSEIDGLTRWMATDDGVPYEDLLDENLGRLISEIDESSILGVEFPKRYMTYARHYDGLLALMGVKTQSDETVGVSIPRDRIQSIDALRGRESTVSYRPRLLLKIDIQKTSEAAHDLVDSGERIGRWYDFSLGAVSLVGYYSNA